MKPAESIVLITLRKFAAKFDLLCTSLFILFKKLAKALRINIKLP